MQGLLCFCLQSRRRKSVNSIRSATQISPLPSFRRKRSGVPKSHSPIAQRALAAGDLSTQSFMSAPSPDHPYRRVPPLEMTIAAGSIHPFPKGTNGKNVSPQPSFGRKRSGAVKSRSPIVQKVWRPEISRLRVSWVPQVLTAHTGASPLEMTMRAGAYCHFPRIKA